MFIWLSLVVSNAVFGELGSTSKSHTHPRPSGPFTHKITWQPPCSLCNGCFKKQRSCKRLSQGGWSTCSLYVTCVLTRLQYIVTTPVLTFDSILHKKHSRHGCHLLFSDSQICHWPQTIFGSMFCSVKMFEGLFLYQTFITFIHLPLHSWNSKAVPPQNPEKREMWVSLKTTALQCYSISAPLKWLQNCNSV